MQIQFNQSHPESVRLVAHVVDQGKLPSGIEATIASGAEAARFTGRAGQLFEGFVERDGKVLRVALAGAGEAGAEDRLANLERAGGALSGKYQSSGETTLVLDVTGSGLSGADVAAVLLGLRLRNWRYDIYHTKMKDEQRVSLASVVVIGAPADTEAAWAEAAHIAAGVEFTRELVTEPANIIYPEIFVAR